MACRCLPAAASLAGGVAQDGEHNSIFVVGWTHAFSPTLIMDSYVSYLHLPLYRTAHVTIPVDALTPDAAVDAILQAAR